MKKKLKDFYGLVEGIDTAMLTTRRRDGRLVSRPMANQDAATGADLWFVTSSDAPKLAEIERNPHVNLAYYKDRTREWVSVSGVAKISTNKRKIRELYRPNWRAWFSEDGDSRHGTPDDPRMVLIGVDIESAVFLELNKPQAVILYEVVKRVVTGKKADLGKTKRVTKRELKAPGALRKPAKRSRKKSSA